MSMVLQIVFFTLYEMGSRVAAPINGRKKMGFPGVISPLFRWSYGPPLINCFC